MTAGTADKLDTDSAPHASNRVRVKAMTPYDDVLGYSRVVCIAGEAWVSACAPLDAQGLMVGVGNAYAQARQCIRNIADALAKVDFGVSEVVRTRIYLRSFEHLDDVARAHREVFAQVGPACAVVAVADLVRPDMLVYIEADARKIRLPPA
jgi:enamine deaminase RidA (YjgF/YER057c/UK114 family)